MPTHSTVPIIMSVTRWRRKRSWICTGLTGQSLGQLQLGCGSLTGLLDSMKMVQFFHINTVIIPGLQIRICMFVGFRSRRKNCSLILGKIIIFPFAFLTLFHGKKNYQYPKNCKFIPEIRTALIKMLDPDLHKSG